MGVLYVLRYIELAKQLNNGYVGYLVFGEDYYFKKEASSKILQSLNITSKELNVSYFNEEQEDEFLRSIATPPLIDNFRFSQIKLQKPSTSFIKGLSTYMKDPSRDSIFVVVCDSGASQLSFLTQVDCSFENSPILEKWITIYLKKAGLIASPEFARELLRRSSNNMDEISKLCDILIAYCYGRDKVTVADLDNFQEDVLEEDIFALINYIIAKNSKKAIALFQAMTRKRIEETKIIATLYSSYRRMFFSAVSPQSDAELASILKVKPYAITKSREQARKFTKLKLKKSLDAIADMEENIKTGKISAKDSTYDLILKLMQEKL